MENKEIIEGNKLIAKFMGCSKGPYDKHSKDNLIHFPDNFPIKIRMSRGGNHLEVDWLEFHSSWDWLMPVIEKIQVEHFVTIERNSTLIHEDGFDSKIINKPFGYGEQESYIQITWKAVIDFIKWYNNERRT